MNTTQEMLFQNQRFSILSLKVQEAEEQHISDCYGYAWYEKVYPFFHDNNEYHKPYGEFFQVSETMMDELSKFLDDNWVKKQPVSFYDLEDHYHVRDGATEWDRVALLHACRYMRLNGLFDDGFWSTLCENGKSPSEASSILRKFTASDIYI